MVVAGGSTHLTDDNSDDAMDYQSAGDGASGALDDTQSPARYVGCCTSQFFNTVHKLAIVCILNRIL